MLSKEQEEVWDRLKYVPPKDMLISFSVDGTTMRVDGYEYTLSTPWNASTATYNGRYK